MVESNIATQCTLPDIDPLFEGMYFGKEFLIYEDPKGRIMNTASVVTPSQKMSVGKPGLSLVRSKVWRWQWVFPQKNQWKNTKTGEQGRHHAHESIIQKAVAGAVRKADLAKHATCHTFRHSFATNLLEGATTFGQSRSSSGIRT